MNIAYLKEILEVQKDMYPTLNARFIKGCERFEAVFDKDNHLFEEYVYSFYTYTVAGVILRLYKKKP